MEMTYWPKQPWPISARRRAMTSKTSRVSRVSGVRVALSMTKGWGWAMASARAASRCGLVEGPVVGGPRLAGEELGDRLGMAGGLLADVQVHQMEAEALGEPDQVLQGPGGRIGVPVVDQGVADQVEVGEKFPVAPVALRQRLS